MQRRCKQVDVFGRAPFKGNPVAVVLDAEGLSQAEMQTIATWTNLSETTFVLPAERGGDYRVRIFDPQEEMKFAGHPTLGTAHAVLESRAQAAGRVGAASPVQLVQECDLGLVNVSLRPQGQGSFAELVAPPRSLHPVDARVADELLAALEVKQCRGVSLCDVGPRWWVVDLGAEDRVAALAPALGRLAELSRRHGATGVTVFGRGAGEGRLRVRSFAPGVGVPEDPVCGSGNISVATYLLAAGELSGQATYDAWQGQEMGRDGLVKVRVDRVSDTIAIGGAALTIVDGILHA